MRQLIGILLFIPLAVFIGIFAVENRAPLALEVWPLAGTWEMWASVWILGLLAIGVLAGMAIGWLAGGAARRRARRAERLSRTLERQLAERDVDQAMASAEARAAAAPEAALPSPAARAARTAQIGD